MKKQIILLSVSQYRITDDKTKEVEIEGCSIRYLFSDNLSPSENEQRNTKGYRPAKANVPFGDYDTFPTVPGLYDAEISCNVDAKGNAVFSPSNFTFVSGIAVTKVSPNGKSSG